MSLVGSLADLGLGEILQIVHLSGKSGVLILRSERGEGHVVFEQGLIRAAQRKGRPSELHELLAEKGLVEASELEELLAESRARRLPFASLAAERARLDPEALDELLRQHILDVLLEMFAWPSGDFSFEIRDAGPGTADELFLGRGVNPQFLALEISRQLDELHEGEAGAGALPSGADPFQADPAGALDAAFPSVSADEAEAGSPSVSLHEAEAAAPAAPPDEVESAASADAPSPQGSRAESASSGVEGHESEPVDRSPGSPPAALVVIDPELAVLEWIKSSLGDAFPRLHVFQHSDLGVARIRQYLARAEVPLVLIASDASGDRLTGARDCLEIVRRLKTLLPRLPVCMLLARGSAPPRLSPRDAVPDRFLTKPTLTDLADARAVRQREECTEALRGALDGWFRCAGPSASARE